LFSQDSITVITATIGDKRLSRCVQSVQQQTFERIQHLVVVDGPEHRQKAMEIMQSVGQMPKKVFLIPLPFPTGRSGWCGHRIYGAYSFLCNTEFVCYLDEDNWFEPDHVESLVAEIRRTSASWGFSL
jgi:glycosyltransferase involved in cell wall biosynthesis